MQDTGHTYSYAYQYLVRNKVTRNPARVKGQVSDRYPRLGAVYVVDYVYKLACYYAYSKQYRHIHIIPIGILHPAHTGHIIPGVHADASASREMPASSAEESYH